MTSRPGTLPLLPVAAAEYLEALDARLELPARDRIEIQDELAAHLADSIEAIMTEGLDEQHATREALARLGRPEELARQLETARRTTRRLLAGAAGGVFQAAGGLVWGWFLGWGLAFAGVIVAAILLSTLLKPPIDFLAPHLPGIDTSSMGQAIGPALSAAVVAFASWIAARHGVRAFVERSRRSPRAARRLCAIAGPLALTPIVLFGYTAPQSWLMVPAELAIPAAFALGAYKFDTKVGIRLPTWGKVLTVVAVIVLPIVALFPVSVSSGGTVTPVPVDASAQQAALDRVAPAWGGNVGSVVGSESGVIEYQPTLDLDYSHLNGPSLSAAGGMAWHEPARDARPELGLDAHPRSGLFRPDHQPLTRRGRGRPPPHPSRPFEGASEPLARLRRGNRSGRASIPAQLPRAVRQHVLRHRLGLADRRQLKRASRATRPAEGYSGRVRRRIVTSASAERRERRNDSWTSESFGRSSAQFARRIGPATRSGTGWGQPTAATARN